MHRAARLLLAAALVAGCMAKPAPEPSVEEREVAVPAMGAVEVDFEMDEGAEVAISIDAERDVSWDIHSHPEGRLMTWRQGSASAMDVTFTAPRADVYSVMLMGGGDASRASVTLRGVFSLVG